MASDPKFGIEALPPSTFPSDSSFPSNTPAARPSTLSTILSPLTNLIGSINAAKERLDLPEPGKAEELGREVKMTHLTQWTFDGARADLAKTFSHDPVFQVTHAFAAGGQNAQGGGVNPGTYNFSAAYALGSKYLLQGNLDNEGSLSGRTNYTWSPNDVSKIQASLPAGGGQSAFVFEHDRVGRDYTINLKAINPSPVNSWTGTYDATFLQSFTSHLALGAQVYHENPQPGQAATAVGYIAKYHRVTKDLAGTAQAGSWIATAQSLPQGMWQATYWKKLGERIDAAVDLMMIPSLVPTQRRAIATAGVKYDFRQSTMRGQVDSQGKVSALLEHRLTPMFSFLVSGELDHKSSTSKFGVGIMLDSMDEEVMNAAQQAQAQAPPS